MGAAHGESVADVVIIGAGLSGLTAALRLKQAGIDRVTIVDARDRLGGRIHGEPGSGSRMLDSGAEMLGSAMHRLCALADELGVERVPMPFGEGKFVRFDGDERFVEAEPFENDPEGAAAHAAAATMIDELAAQVPIEDPWNAPRAREWDSITLQSWIDANVSHGGAAAALATEYLYCGATPSELSFLYVLWFTNAMGGSEALAGATGERFNPGTFELTRRLSAQLDTVRFELEAPVRLVRRDGDGVTVETDRGAFRGRQLIAALSPQMCARIEWVPALPPIRDRLQDRYMQGHGLKMVARYERPWWRDAGYAGIGSGLSPIGILLDTTWPGSGEGQLTAHIPATAEVLSRFSDDLYDDQSAYRLFRRAVDLYFGPDAPEPIGFTYFNWLTDPYSVGCAVGLPPGVLSTVGPALRAPVDSIVWAGAEAGVSRVDWMEGAVDAGERAAVTVRERLGR